MVEVEDLMAIGTEWSGVVSETVECCGVDVVYS